MTRKHTLLLFVPIALGVLVSGCGDDEEEAETSTNVAAGIGGSTWILENDSIDVEVPESMEEITLAFTTDGSFAGHAGCNNYTGTYTITDDGGLILGEPGVTRMMCEEGFMAAEAAYLAEFVQVTSYAIDGSELTLSGADGELLTYQADE